MTRRPWRHRSERSTASGRRPSGRRPSCGRKRRRAGRPGADRRTRARDDGKMRRVEDAGIVASRLRCPRRHRRRCTKNSSRRLVTRASCRRRSVSRRVRRPPSRAARVRCAPAGVPHGQRDHRESMEARRARAAGRCGGMCDGIDQHLSRAERALRRRGRGRDDRSGSDRTCRRACRRAASCASTAWPASDRRFARRRIALGAAARHAASSSSRHAGAGDAGDPEEGQPERRGPRAASALDALLGSSSASILFAATSCGLAASVGSNSSSSRRTVSRSSTGSRPVAPETSTRCTSTLVRSRWRRNWWPRPRPAVRAFDQARHVGDHEAAVVAQADHAEIRRQRRERVVGDLRPRRRDARDQRGLAGVGETDEPDVGEQLQLETEILFFARLARLHFSRRAVRGRREPRVAHAAASAAGDEHALAFDARGRRAAAAVRPVVPVFS